MTLQSLALKTINNYLISTVANFVTEHYFRSSAKVFAIIIVANFVKDVYVCLCYDSKT